MATERTAAMAMSKTMDRNKAMTGVEALMNKSLSGEVLAVVKEPVNQWLYGFVIGVAVGVLLASFVVELMILA